MPRSVAVTVGKIRFPALHDGRIEQTLPFERGQICRGGEPNCGRAGQQLCHRHLEAAFRPGKYFRWQSVKERLAQHALADRLAADQCELLPTRHSERPFDYALSEKGRSRLQRMRHAHAVDFHQHVRRQFQRDVAGQHRVDRIITSDGRT